MGKDRTSAARTRISIDGVATRISANVASRKPTGMTVAQELPFLAVGRTVQTDDGRTARIARVGLGMEKGVPRLVLELAYEPPGKTPARPPRPPAVKSERERDRTIGYDERPHRTKPGISTPTLMLEAMSARQASKLLDTVHPALLPLAFARHQRPTVLERFFAWLGMAFSFFFAPRPA